MTTYPGALVFCASCQHMEQVHHYGQRGGEQRRTACSHQDEAGYCPCRLFVQPVLMPVEVCPTCRRPR